jgi:hypothetical protein
MHRVIRPDTAWNNLSITLRLSMSTRDLVGPSIATWSESSCSSANARPENHVGRIWSDVASAAERHRRLERHAVDSSTWIAAAPAPAAATLEALSVEMRERGATLYAPVAPALPEDDPAGIGHVGYRASFSRAEALEAGRLAAAAFVDVATAVHEAAARSRTRERVTYDAVSDEVEVGHGQSRVAFDAESLAFMAIMSGVLPEHVLQTAMEESSLRVERIARLIEAVQQAVGPHDVRYADYLPVYRSASPTIADPIGAPLHRRRGASQRLGGPDSICRSPTCVAGVRMPRRTASSRDAAPVYRPPLARRRHHTRDSYASAWFEPTYRLTTKAIVV